MAHPHDVHLLMHLVRMTLVMAAEPAHPRGKEYADQIGAYRVRWAQLSPEQRDDVRAAVTAYQDDGVVVDMTDVAVAGALSLLEA